MKLVAVASPSFAPLAMLADLDGVEVVATDHAATLGRAIADADAVVVAPRAGALLREAWPYARRVRWVHTLAAGVDTLLFPELVASDAIVTNARGVFSDALGEFAVAAMLWFAKDLGRMRRNQEARRWQPFDVDRLEGATVSIIGLGSIGHAVARRCKALGMKVIGVRRTDGSLENALRDADYVVVTTPLTDATRGLIGARELALLKPTAVIINIGRGAVIDEAALLDALQNERVRGAALDVFAHEPLPPDHPLWTLENVLLSPHTADHTADAHDRSMRMFLENLARFRRGEELMNVVDKQQRY